MNSSDELVYCLLGIVFLFVSIVVVVLTIFSRLFYRLKTWREQPPPPKWPSARYFIRAIVLLDIAVWIGFKDYFVTTQGGGPTFYRSTGQPLPYSFHIDGELYLSWVKCCISDQPGYLCRRSGIGYVRIESLEQLKGEVQIKTSGDVLAYVRLLTNPNTSWSFGLNDFYEVTARERAGPEFAGYGQDGLAGVVPLEWMTSHHIAQPSVQKTANGWIVYRTCVNPSAGKTTLLSVIEEIGANGSYSRTEQSFKVNPVNHIQRVGEAEG